MPKHVDRRQEGRLCAQLNFLSIGMHTLGVAGNQRQVHTFVVIAFDFQTKQKNMVPK